MAKKAVKKATRPMKKSPAVSQLDMRLQQRQEAANQETKAPHIIVVARAGTGKTTTLEGAVAHLHNKAFRLSPSPQQALIWDAISQDKEFAYSICLTSFSRAITDELGKRLGTTCTVLGLHQMGNRAIRGVFHLLPGHKGVQSRRTFNLLGELLGMDPWELFKTRPSFVKAVEELVGLCKQTLLRTDLLSEGDLEEELQQLADHYDVDLNGGRSDVFSAVPKIMERSKDIATDRYIDFNDMIWLPIVLNLPLPKFSLLLIDEAQDLNRCQQELAFRVGDRLVFVGDSKQAIYGFAGADTESIDRLTRILSETDRQCETLYLTVTRRCGKAIVAEAQKYVPDFEAHESNPEGVVRQDKMDTYRPAVQDGDMVLCRVNAPLVSECFRFLRDGRKANIRGRDIGKNLITTIKKLKAVDAFDLVEKLSNWYQEECQKEAKKKPPSEARLINLEDRYECLNCFCEGPDVHTVDDVIVKIENIFSDDTTDGVMLSSVHKAKGLESDRVFILMPERASMPHPMAKTDWQKEQEIHLLYVAITRAKEELVYVS